MAAHFATLEFRSRARATRKTSSACHADGPAWACNPTCPPLHNKCKTPTTNAAPSLRETRRIATPAKQRKRKTPDLCHPKSGTPTVAAKLSPENHRAQVAPTRAGRLQNLPIIQGIQTPHPLLPSAPLAKLPRFRRSRLSSSPLAI